MKQQTRHQFIKDEIYKRTELHDRYGGQMQGGISTPSQHNIILLFTSQTGEQYGYKDGWTAERVFLYTGEGQVGDMTFTRGNRVIRDHLQLEKELHLFEYVNRGYVRYIGQMMYRGFQYRKGRDINGNERKVIVFELTPVK
ncbi:MAG: HNH endonuclease [Chloroflexi bacterium]|nr:HNH endonuclease [Chloroflexota bacterium]